MKYQMTSDGPVPVPGEQRLSADHNPATPAPEETDEYTLPWYVRVWRGLKRFFKRPNEN